MELLKRAAIVAALVAAPAHAAEKRDNLSVGNAYYSTCVAGKSDLAVCIGYFMGMSDAPVMNTGEAYDDAVYCSPDGATYQQNIDIFHNWLNANPKLRHVSTHLLFLMAMNEAFPCRNSPYITYEQSTGGVRFSKPKPRAP